MFIAYAYLRNGKEVYSTVHETRDVAATELMLAHPAIPGCATAKAHNGFNTGNHILFHNRPDDMQGKHKAFSCGPAAR